MTASEADERWGLPTGEVRQSCNRGKLKKYIEKGLVRQSGKVWLVTEKAMIEVYGEPKQKT
ncbi:helix-turn-helix domain-containing protein [Fictibacillus gelatini]|uniref:helix-turn-helix domain-containing protein n=1 Tax=Fictibacillus gelatini TaxID=225985 RepID=UPI00054FAFCA|nr:helix-turn-helix domain-containing protein [Fictibacillus gelatini]